MVMITTQKGNEGHKLFLVWIGPIPLVIITHADTFKEILKQTREKCKGPTDGYKYFDAWLGDGLLMSEGRKWERNRKLLTPAFHFDILNGYIQTMNEGSDLLLDKLALESAGGKSVDIFPYVCKTTLDTMLKCSLSYEGNLQNDITEKENEYIQAVKTISVISWRRSTEIPLTIQPIFRLHPVGREYYKMCDISHKFTGALIQSRIDELKDQKPESNPSDGKKRRLDFLDILLTAKDEAGNGLTREEIQHEVDTFTFEGHDTTASAISWSVYALGKFPDLQQKVYEDVCSVLGDSDTVTKDDLGKFKYLPLFIKETMRYYSPVPMIGRSARDSPIILDGKEIPPHISIYMNIYAIHHNESIWPDHMKFDPERFSADHRDETDIYGFVPFSAGSRNCIGQAFALNEIKINVAKLVKRFEVSLDATQEAELLPDIVMRAENGMYIKFKSRK